MRILSSAADLDHAQPITSFNQLFVERDLPQGKPYRWKAADGTSMNQFLVMAAAEKLTAIQTAEAFFAARKGQGDKDAAIRFLTRPGGEPPRRSELRWG